MNENIIIRYLMREELDKKLSQDTPELHRLISVVSDAYDELLKVLDDNQKALLEKFKNALEEHDNEEIDRFFVEGFIAGINIGFAAKV
jgi:hypothetical protein